MNNFLINQTQTFRFTEEQELLRKTIREVAEENFKEKARETDKTHKFPRENFNLLAKLGITGLIIPEKYGGSELDYISYVIAIKEIARVCAVTSVILGVHSSLCSMPIVKFGSECLKEKYLRKLACGELLGAYCLSEPGSGSDAAAMQTKAEDKGSYFILNGTKAWITNGSEADVYIVFAQTNPDLKHKGITAFILEKNIQGVSFGKLEDKLGIRASATCQMHLDNVKVPEENLLGNIGDGFKIAMSTLDRGRIGIAAQALGIAQASYDLASSYAKAREAFGQKIINFQAIQFMLVEIATEIEAGQLLTCQAANMYDLGLKFTRQAAEAKLFCSELASKAANKAVQILGGYGYTTEYDAQRYLRDAKITEIYEGTSEIQRIVIAENIIKTGLTHMSSN
ncbi:MAG: acyl-CoA dehydrogenase [Candidatus Melainabacteria bacterium RIFCSPLOWO2_02_FULL_35_15]|nr:MAG: acyl-CoA dehydrogenase [Candidatus Melainabacteria bacterium RIFCSPLOWO2_12_FULL_35_11]OGI13242.1 MAG: acyl-CoA dehydrogenase [Candidatus Melainabacteria bacterium RIFCSPLOWO2_02_FULL_35_15]